MLEDLHVPVDDNVLYAYKTRELSIGRATTSAPVFTVMWGSAELNLIVNKPPSTQLN